MCTVYLYNLEKHWKIKRSCWQKDNLLLKVNRDNINRCRSHLAAVNINVKNKLGCFAFCTFFLAIEAK